MILEESDMFRDEVFIADTAHVFHLLTEREESDNDGLHPACYDPGRWARSDPPKKVGLSDAIEMGKRPCKQCMIRLSAITGVTSKECALCDRVNVIHDIGYSTHTVEYAYAGEKEVNICLNCSVKFGMDVTSYGDVD